MERVTRHFEKIRNLVQEGIRCKQAMNHYESILSQGLDDDDLDNWGEHYWRYAEICRELRAKPEDIAERWAGEQDKNSNKIKFILGV